MSADSKLSKYVLGMKDVARTLCILGENLSAVKENVLSNFSRIPLMHELNQNETVAYVYKFNYKTVLRIKLYRTPL